jgi:hypothetical protein
MKILLNALLIVIGFSGWGQKAELQNNALDLGRFSEAETADRSPWFFCVPMHPKM